VKFGVVVEKDEDGYYVGSVPELLSEEEYAQLIERGREIQREVVYARYPLKVAGKWVTPMEYYTQEKAKRTIDHAKSVVDAVRTYVKRTRTRRSKR